jgi:hypothetical protein
MISDDEPSETQIQVPVYVLERPGLVDWGDYGDILIGGMAARNEETGLLELERIGPFIPPITDAGLRALIVTDDFRKQLESSGLLGITFRPVVKKRIVHLEWENWDWNAEEPEEYPETGEPEDYILGRPHSPELAQQMGDLWELYLEEHAVTTRTGTNFLDTTIYLELASWDGTDVFRATGVLHNFVSSRAKTWLQATIPRWVSFRALQTESGRAVITVTF